MPKSLVLGNGTVLVGLDFYGQVKDFYYDYVGLENHMSERSINRVGVWVDGEFRWISGAGWEISIDYQKETMASKILAKNTEIGIELELTDIVYNEKSIFLRRV